MKSLLVMRLLILNACGAAGLVWAWNAGYITMAFGADESRICYAIAAVFAVGLVLTMLRAIKIASLMNAVKARKTVILNPRKLFAKQAYLADCAVICEKLGMFGTVVGFLMAFYGVDPDGEPKAIIGHILIGLSVAFFTTAVGFVAGLWLSYCVRMLHTATVCLVEDAGRGDQ